MNARKRRKLRPSERARQDQAAAAARDYGAADPSTTLVTVTYADPGTPCCWCDCPLPSHNQSGYGCAGCPREAEHVVHLMHGTPAQHNLPVCAEHHRDVARTVAVWAREVFGGIPFEVRSYPVLDEDQDGIGGDPR